MAWLWRIHAPNWAIYMMETVWTSPATKKKKLLLTQSETKYSSLSPIMIMKLNILHALFTSSTTFVPKWLCPDTLVPSAHTNLCPHKWHNHAQRLLAKRSEMWFFNYCSPITSSISTGIFCNFINTCQGTKYVSGHKRVRLSPDMIVTTRL